MRLNKEEKKVYDKICTFIDGKLKESDIQKFDSVSLEKTYRIFGHKYLTCCVYFLGYFVVENTQTTFRLKRFYCDFDYVDKMNEDKICVLVNEKYKEKAKKYLKNLDKIEEIEELINSVDEEKSKEIMEA